MAVRQFPELPFLVLPLPEPQAELPLVVAVLLQLPVEQQFLEQALLLQAAVVELALLPEAAPLLLLFQVASFPLPVAE